MSKNAVNMDDKLKHYLDVWKLTDPEPLAQTGTSHVCTVTFEGTRVVLKILTPAGGEERNGAVALRCFDGHGAVKLLRVDDGAHLLEYADGDDLVGMVRGGEDERATAIIGDVLNQLHAAKPPFPEGLVPLKRWFRELFERAEADQQAGIDSLYVRGAHMTETLLAAPRDVTVLHGDIHHENIRYHRQRGWLAFDPKGLVGERTFDAANTLCNPMNMEELVENEKRIIRIASILADKMGIERSRVLSFTFAYCCLSAVWSENSDDEDPRGALAIAKLVERLL